MIETEHNAKSLERRQLILEAAFGEFGNYGFRRTSMDDIAKAAGISRPSLYQSFSNKNDIFEALVEKALKASLVEAEASLAEDKPLGQQLNDLFEIMLISHHRALESLPHGDEILGMKSEFVVELFAKWDQKKKDVFQRALTKDPSLRHGLGVPMAQTISLAISGMKSRNLKVKDMEKEITALIEVIMAAQSS